MKYLRAWLMITVLSGAAPSRYAHASNDGRRHDSCQADLILEALQIELGPNLVVSAERTDGIVTAEVVDQSLVVRATLEATVDGPDGRTLYVTAVTDAEDDPVWLTALLAAAWSRAPEINTIDIYLTGADFRRSILPDLNDDLAPSRSITKTARFGVLKRLGFANFARLIFGTVGADDENEMQVRVIASRPSVAH